MEFEIYQLDEAGQLFLSPDIHDWAPVLDRKIDVVFDLDGGLDNCIPTTPDGVLYVYMPFNDSGLPNLKRLHALGRFGAALVQDGHRLLSHCGLGFNRSALVAGIVMKHLGLSGPAIVEQIREKRPGALYNPQYANPANLSFDQRGTGFARNSGGGVDIGAYELQAAAAPPQVGAITFNNGANQRSLVTSIKVSFSEAVTIGTGAFVLERFDKGTPGTIGVTVNQVGGDVTLTFNNTGSIALDPGASLPDGKYQLTIVSDNVTGTGGKLDGNKNGTADGSPIDDVTSKVHRLFGDGNGDGTVNAVDFAQFRSVFGLSGPSIFDFNNDNTTSAADFAQFRARFGLGGFAP